MTRLFVPKDQLPVITGPDVHYLRSVLRMKAGDALELFDGTGNVYAAKILKIEDKKIICEIIGTRRQNSEPQVKVTLAQALPKAKKMDFIVEKCVELGVHEIIPMLTERTVVARLWRALPSSRIDRWQKIAKEAAEQCGRAIVPAILPLTNFTDLLKMRGQFNLALIPWELEKEKTLKQALKSVVAELALPVAETSKVRLWRAATNYHSTTYRPNHLLLMIGPEGGFSAKEVEEAQKAEFTSVSLGKRILRAETAGMAALAAIMYELDAE
ncbi:16S rRNA (uracil(1498)-N(3))-methyltransferase [Candidatus Saganbacteria bacterium]|uniref:Ribosomal RNA small subunit methyltransferase E n=1 Tax=Candidatus Saganbacteria bacterium TaxID=2575572 RepID=A0A9D6UKH8_UNCSA|nr:16S rRNA (uracil(1498)-N(3))-methyltransferase [Candidatus Saganbacteria bacterium]